MRLRTVTVAGSATMFAALAVAGPLPAPVVNNAVETFKNLVVRESNSISDSSLILDNIVSHSDEKTGPTQSSIPSGVGSRTGTNTRIPSEKIGATGDFQLGSSSVPEVAYINLTPAEIVAYNNPGPVIIPSESLPTALSSSHSEMATLKIVSRNSSHPRVSSGPKINDGSVAGIVAANNPGLVIPDSPLPLKSLFFNREQTMTGIDLAMNPGPVIVEGPLPPITAKPRIKARSVIVSGVIGVGDSSQVHVPQVTLETVKPYSPIGLAPPVSQRAGLEGVGGNTEPRTPPSQLPEKFEGGSSRRYVPVGVISALLAVSVAFAMM